MALDLDLILIDKFIFIIICYFLGPRLPASLEGKVGDGKELVSASVAMSARPRVPLHAPPDLTPAGARPRPCPRCLVLSPELHWFLSLSVLSISRALTERRSVVSNACGAEPQRERRVTHTYVCQHRTLRAPSRV